MKKYLYELDGQKEFYENYLKLIDKTLSLDDVLADNNDGVINGNLIEFKININDLNSVLFQAIKYLSARRIKGKPIPANIILISLNDGKAYVYSSNDYLLKLDNDNMIYFIIKDTGEEIRYGDDDFLNIVYSKYYENVIKKETSNKFYYDFINIYSELLSTNYKTIDSILSLLNEKMDIINRLLVVLSSAFFAHKKLNIPIKVIYSILDKVIPNVYDYNNFEPKENNNLSERVLSDELINKIIDLKDGTKLTFNDYLSKYDILNNINSNTIVHLKTGEVLNGIDFVNNLYKYVSNYNSFGELFEDLVSLVEYK